jgi:hypothetical protein
VPGLECTGPGKLCGLKFVLPAAAALNMGAWTASASRKNPRRPDAVRLKPDIMVYNRRVMRPLRILPLASLFAVSWFVLGQPPQESFEAVKQALSLTDAQVVELQRNRLRNRQEAVRQHLLVVPRGQRRIVFHFPEGMDDSNKAKLSDIAKTLDRSGAASLAIDLGLLGQEQWPGGADSVCHRPLQSYSGRPLEFGMTESQIHQLLEIRRVAGFPLWPQVREKAMQRQALLDSGVSADSPAVVQLGLDSDRLQKQISARPSRDVVMSLLDSAQKAKLAEFEKELELLRQAVELGLIFDPWLLAIVDCF